MYREGKWPDTPADVSIRTYHNTVRNWVRIEEACGPEALRHKRLNKVWNPEEKLVLIQRVIAGNSIRSVAFEAGINQGLLYQWVQKYKICGYTGLENMKKGRPSKESQMKRKKVNFNNPRPLKETELEELIRLRAENEYIKAENEVIKKEIALREDKMEPVKRTPEKRE